MKKIILGLLLALSAHQAQAQSTPHALGVHFGGSTTDVEYQYHFSKRNFLDVTLGLFDFDKGFAAQGIYNWNLHSWDWTPGFAVWKCWGGYGAGLGCYSHHDDHDLFVGPVGTLGFGFTLCDIPLTVGLDYRPMVAFNLGDSFKVIDSGFRNIGVTLTYRF